MHRLYSYKKLHKCVTEDSPNTPSKLSACTGTSQLLRTDLHKPTAEQLSILDTTAPVANFVTFNCCCCDLPVTMVTAGTGLYHGENGMSQSDSPALAPPFQKLRAFCLCTSSRNMFRHSSYSSAHVIWQRDSNSYGKVDPQAGRREVVIAPSVCESPPGERAPPIN